MLAQLPPDRVATHLAQAHVRAADGGQRPRVHQPLQWNIGNVHRYTLFSSCREWMICANEFR